MKTFLENSIVFLFSIVNLINWAVSCCNVNNSPITSECNIERVHKK